MKTITKAIAILSIAALCATSALAAEGGNPKKGKYLFKKSCKTCHVEDAEGGEVTPLNRTQAQWDRFFERNKHNADAWNKFSEGDLKDIKQFLFDHAADSDQPETCG